MFRDSNETAFREKHEARAQAENGRYIMIPGLVAVGHHRWLAIVIAVRPSAALPDRLQSFFDVRPDVQQAAA